ncbi:hypothetical protein [Micromonospora sp. RP3T]|uniref:hypothetical protein n=1 Tax=Micromonospora sp. RP3T TaxID=2135446 RepID=UPI001304C9C5|nr:hypothetical protein [Micromonospora sp. RP3T]
MINEDVRALAAGGRRAAARPGPVAVRRDAGRHSTRTALALPGAARFIRRPLG